MKNATILTAHNFDNHYIQNIRLEDRTAGISDSDQVVSH